MEAGGAAVLMAPGNVAATRQVVKRLVETHGERAYHGQRWRKEIVQALTVDVTEVGWHGAELSPELGESRAGNMEVLTGEGDLIIFVRPAAPTLTRLLAVTTYCPAANTWL